MLMTAVTNYDENQREMLLDQVITMGWQGNA
jgi:hypothetical protein